MTIGFVGFISVPRRRLRWLLVVPAAVAAWYLVFIGGMLTYEFVEDALCPVGEMESGVCLNDRVQLMLRFLVHLFVALSGAAVVATAVAVAPSNRNRTAWIAFAGGSVVAVAFGLAAWAYTEAVAAVASGLITAMAITQYLRR